MNVNMTNQQKIIRLPYLGTKDYDDLLICKIQKMHYLKDIQNGHIYMKNIKYHKKQGKIFPDTHLGDTNEGLVFEGATLVNVSRGMVFSGPMGGTVSLFDENPIFCAMQVKFKNETDDQFISTLDPRMYKDFLHDSDEKYGIIYINATEFIERCKKILGAMKVSWMYDEIEYTNDNVFPEIIVNRPWRAIFRKNEEYSYQNEVRLWINIDVKDNYVLELGDLTDISSIFPIDPMEKIPELTINKNI